MRIIHSEYSGRWVLGVSLRRPWETSYPMYMPNPAAYDRTLKEIVTEEFFRARVRNLLRVWACECGPS